MHSPQTVLTHSSMISDGNEDNFHKLHDDDQGFGMQDDASAKTDDFTSKDKQIRNKKVCKYFNRCLWVTLGIIFAVGFELLAFVVGWVTIPNSNTSLDPPQCYACVDIVLDGNYHSIMQYTQGGLQFNVTLHQDYNGDAGTVDIIYDVITGSFTACDCESVPFELGAINCTITTVYDDCMKDCDEANGITQLSTLYDPTKDTIESNILIAVKNVSVPHVTTFTRV